ncbi:hypothetical protein IQ07DRAFT_592644 [Pyrenochaeta sp. DS3sAY3a]|nr:hypothetical protein IQ07DRAFT_592644 [Pyrenochaeta sp. DS3sAY3a]
MLFNTLLISALASSALAFPFNQVAKRSGRAGNRRTTPAQAALPDCSPDFVTCRCPADSFYQTSSSYIFWPVPAAEITRLTLNFHETAWFGTSPERVEGNATAVGSKRFLRTELPDSFGTELIVEELTELELYEDGGYWMKFQMGDQPFWYQKKARGQWGLLAGSYDLIDVREVNGMAYMLWDIHICFMDHFDLAAFHESGMNNLTAILKAEGTMPENATTIGPITF